MKTQRRFTVKDFARLSRTSRDTLIYYDKIGLLSPAIRGANNYRYYSTGQLSIINVIRIFRELDLPLNRIRSLMRVRTPENTFELLTQQIGSIDERIEHWGRSRRLLATLRGEIKSTMDVDTDRIEIKYLPAEAIILGKLNDYSNGRTDYDALLDFYIGMSVDYPELDLNYPVWAVFSMSSVKSRKTLWPERYYFYNPNGYDKRPAAEYAIGYTYGGYGEVNDLYERMLYHIDENGYEIDGDIYEEYPQNEISTSDNTRYLIRVLMTVAARDPGA